MGDRVGFGAALASAVVFSILLLANFAIVIGSDQEARMSAESDAESSLYDRAQVMAAEEGIILLGRLQDLLVAQVFPCQGIAQTVQGEMGTISTTLTAEPLTVNASLSVGSNSPGLDDLGLLRPFDGFVKGWLNLVLSVSAVGEFPALRVSLHEDETHYLNLPVRVDAIESFCQEAVDSIATTLAGSEVKGCSSGSVSATMTPLQDALAMRAGTLGLTFDMSYSTVQGDGCLVHFVLVVSQERIPGPDGPFTMSVEQEGSVVLPI